jgi:hypothetical protein
MPRSDPPRETGRRPDWRGWIMLAWVVWCGLLYGKMVVERRGGKLQGWITPASAGARPAARGLSR